MSAAGKQPWKQHGVVQPVVTTFLLLTQVPVIQSLFDHVSGHFFAVYQKSVGILQFNIQHQADFESKDTAFCQYIQYLTLELRKIKT